MTIAPAYASNVAALLLSDDAACLTTAKDQTVWVGTKHLSQSFSYKNKGSSTWSGSGYAMVPATEKGNEVWGLNAAYYVGFPSVLSNKNKSFSLKNFTAPAVAGDYDLGWQMAKANADGSFTRFGQVCSKKYHVINKPVADLSVKKIGPATIEKGTELVYTLQVTNNGPDNLSAANLARINTGFGTRLTSLVFVPQAGSNCHSNATTDGVFCDIASLDAGQTISIDLHFSTSAVACDALIGVRGGVHTNAVDTNSNNDSDYGTKTKVTCTAAVKTGNLFVSKTAQPVAHQLLGGALGESILTLQFRAENEDVDVTNLQFNTTGSLASSVDRLELYKLGDTSPFARATVDGCGSDAVETTNDDGTPSQVFCASMQNRQLVVADGTSLLVNVLPRLKSDETGAISGEAIQIYVHKRAVSDNATGSGAVRARGLQSHNSLIGNNGNNTSEGEVFIGKNTVSPDNEHIVGSKHVSVLSKLASITNANPDADGTSIPTGVAGIGLFTFTAATNSNTLNGLNKVVFDGLIFNVNATNVDLDGASFKIYDKADASRKASCGILRATESSALLIGCQNLTASVVDTRIRSGESKTFVLEASVQKAQVNSFPSTLQVSFNAFNDSVVTPFGTDESHVSWFDKDVFSTQFFWIESVQNAIDSTKYQN